MKKTKAFFAALLCVFMLFTMLPISALATSPAPDFILNGVDRYWNEIDYIPLTGDDTLEFKTAPNKPMKIQVFSPDNSVVTIKGNSVNAIDTYVIVDNDITLNLEDLKITAPLNKSGITLNNDYTETDLKTMTLIISGICDITGSGFGDGITSQSDQKLIITGNGTLNVTGGNSTTQNTDGGRGINMIGYTYTPLGRGADLLIDGNVTVNARGGNSDTHSGGEGIIVQWGSMIVKSGTVNATSGDAYGTNYNAAAGMKASFPANDHSYGGNITIEGGSVTATGGYAENADGGTGVSAFNALKVKGGTFTATGGNSKKKYGGTAIYGYEQNMEITGGTVLATGGDSTEFIGGIAVYSHAGHINVTNASITAKGGNSAGANGGVGVYAYEKDVYITGGDLTAIGGNSPVNGAHGIFAYRGKIEISNGANITSNGGNGGTGVGGAGIRAFGYNDVSQSSFGNTVSISSDAGNVYVLGGQGASARRGSIMGKDVFISTGNIGSVVMEGTGPRSIKNKPSGNDVYLLAAATSPAAADVIVQSDVNGALGGSYTYKSVTKSDGIANMWLPAGSQTAYASGYTSRAAELAANDAQPQSATLHKPAKLDTPISLAWDSAVRGKATWQAVSGASSYTVQLFKNGSTVGSAVYGLTNPYYDFSSLITESGPYVFKVKAVGSGIYLDSDTSNESPAIGFFAVTTVSGDRQATLHWNSVTEATYYKLYMSTIPGQFDQATVTDVTYMTTYTMLNLNNGTTYYFLMKAGNPEGLNVWSNEASATPAAVPEAPTNVYANAGDGRAEITFTAPTGNGGSAITGYEITASPGNIVKTGVTGSPFVFTGLENGTRYTFTVKAINNVGKSSASAPSNEITPRASSTDSDPETPANTRRGKPGNSPAFNESAAIEVLVNGKIENAGTAASTTRGNQSVTTVAVDQKKLEDKLAAEGNHAVVTIPVNTKSDIVIGELNGQMVKNMESKQAVLEIKTERATYTLPAQQININAISSQIGRSVALQEIKVHIEIAAPAPETVKVVKNAAEKGAFTLVAPPVNFEVRAAYGGETVQVSTFNAYVERTIAIPDGVDPNKITTGVAIDPDGTVRHVPTKVVMIDGKYFAKLNSLTNSTYSVVWHPLEFSDAADHWAKDAVNDMGSRMVIEGKGGGLFVPDKEITRGEFAAIIVRGLGLKLENGTSPFSDVNVSDWYNGTIKALVAYRLIEGFEDGTFRPGDKITREQAMLIVAKAMKITKLKEKMPDQTTEEALRSYADAEEVSGWAKSGVADCLQTGIVSGRSTAELAPKSFITRAEVAAIVKRLLKMSDLI